MEKEIEDYKQEFIEAYMALSVNRKAEIALYYDKSITGVPSYIIREAKENAQSVIDYADRHDYGYGEVGYNLNEEVKEFAREVPELEKQYKRLIQRYFNLLVETKES